MCREKTHTEAESQKHKSAFCVRSDLFHYFFRFRIIIFFLIDKYWAFGKIIHKPVFYGIKCILVLLNLIIKEVVYKTKSVITFFLKAKKMICLYRQPEMWP